MQKFAPLLICGLAFFLNISQAQEIIIGKENISSPDIPIRPGNMFNFQYNQFIYKQPWIHAQGSINKIAYYYNGASSVSYEVKIYMGHTSRRNFANREYIPIKDLTLVYNGPFTFPGATGWLEITLQTPFIYNNIDNLVIAIDKNSVDPQSQDDSFSSSILSDDFVSIIARDQYYNIDPANPQGIVGFSREIPNIKISGTLTVSPYIYVYGSRERNVSTDPNSTILTNVLTNVIDYTVNNDQAWLSTTKNITDGTLTAKVISSNSSLNENKRTARLILSGNGARNDTLFINQYRFEPRNINSLAFSFVDYNNDSNLDLTGKYPEIADNTGNGSFSFRNLSIPGISNGLSFWGDYDNDGDLDFLIIGYDQAMNRITKIFRNDGNDVFIDIMAPLKIFREMTAGVWSFAQWRDYNNDGKLDIIISGLDNDNSSNTILYKNLGNDKFVNSGISFQKALYGNSDWGDYNNDGLADLVMLGEDENGNCVTTVYKNQGGEKFIRIETNILGLRQGNANWGDYDNDGDLDLLVTGGTNNYGAHLKIYRNDGKDIFKDIDAGLKMDALGWTKWLDYDNNGYLDIISYSSGYGNGGFLRRFKNSGNGQFIADHSDIIPEFWQGARFSTGDYDKDGDMDFIIHHAYKNYTQIFRNNSNTANNPPSIPAGLRTFRNGTRVYLQWNRATDDETNSKTLTYNVRVGTSPGKGDIVSPHANLSIGSVTIPEMGNSYSDTIFILENLPLGTYYWSVQSIDNMYKGSEFTAEKSFSVMPPFSKIAPGIAALYNASAAWGDYDNDNDMDLVVTGRLTAYDGETTRIYKNKGDSTFTEIILNVPGKYAGSVVWGDYDNDNDLDIIISGRNSSGQESARILRNDGNDQFPELTNAFPSTQISSAIWGDIDNDGDLDIAVNKFIYTNNGNSAFDLQYVPEPPDGRTINSFADYDNDNDLDFFLGGQDIPQSVFKNNNGIFTPSTVYKNHLFWGSMDWGDYDNDGDLDLLLSGYNSDYNNLTIISRNDGNGSFINIQTNIRGVSQGQAHWGDFDNDGDLDIVVGGFSGNRILKVYENKKNNSFEEIYNHPVNPDLATEQVDYAVWGDYNNDGNLDFIKNGLLFSNNYNTPNIAPSSPANLKASLTGFDAFLSWEDTKNPVGVTYNIRIGTTPGGTQIMSPMANLQTGYRKIPALGNVQNNKSWIIKNLTPGVTYYWSVQSIDPAFKGGAWATEKSFTVRNVYPGFSADTVCLGLTTKFTDQSISPSELITSWRWDFGDGNISVLQNPANTYKSSGNFIVKLVVKTASFADSVYKTVVIKPRPSADFTADVSCQGIATPITNKTNLNDLTPVKWEWDFGDTQKSLLKDPLTHGYILSGDYLVELKVTTNNGCYDSIQKHVIVGSYPVAVITANDILTFCGNDSVTLSVTSGKDYTYTWQRDETGITNATTANYTAKLSGNYTVTVTNTAGNCKTTSQKTVVTSLPKPSVPKIVTENYEKGKQCPGVTQITLKVEQPVAGHSYQWLRNGTPVSNATASTYKGIMPAGDYTVVSSKDICTSESVAQTIEYDLAPEVPSLHVKGPVVWYMATGINTYKHYRWYYNDQLIAGATKYIYVANKKLGTYRVEVANENLCFTSSANVTIPTSKSGTTEFNVPSEYRIGNEQDISDAIKIYPNPTPGLFTIEMNNEILGELNISIATQTGKEILKIKLQKSTEHFITQVDLSGQPRGMYIINLLIDKYYATSKLIVE